MRLPALHSCPHLDLHVAPHASCRSTRMPQPPRFRLASLQVRFSIASHRARDPMTSSDRPTPRGRAPTTRVASRRAPPQRVPAPPQAFARLVEVLINVGIRFIGRFSAFGAGFARRHRRRRGLFASSATDAIAHAIAACSTARPVDDARRVPSTPSPAVANSGFAGPRPAPRSPATMAETASNIAELTPELKEKAQRVHDPCTLCPPHSAPPSADSFALSPAAGAPRCRAGAQRDRREPPAGDRRAPPPVQGGVPDTHAAARGRRLPAPLPADEKVPHAGRPQVRAAPPPCRGTAVPIALTPPRCGPSVGPSGQAAPQLRQVPAGPPRVL